MAVFRKNFLKVYLDVYFVSSMKTIRVEEVMSRNPVIIPGHLTVREGAKLLMNKGVSTLIVEEDGKYIGIITDRDLITKILAVGINPSKTKLEEVMSHPVIMISATDDISVAARVMSRRRIRKLPVIKDERIIGLLSENDIVRIAPDLMALAQEYSEINTTLKNENRFEEYLAGRCEACGQYSLRLRSYQGMLICPECYESLR